MVVELGKDIFQEETDEREVVRRAQEGDLRSYGSLVQSYERQAYGLAYSFMGNREDAEDMLQESFLQAFRALPRFRQDSSFRTWFFRILINRCRSEQRKRAWKVWIGKESPEGDPEEPQQPLVQTTPREEAAADELCQRVEEAIQTLPTRQRLVFTMKALEGMTLREIAELLGLRLGTVKAHLFQATQKMQHALKEYV